MNPSSIHIDLILNKNKVRFCCSFHLIAVMLRNGKKKMYNLLLKPFKCNITFVYEGKMPFECNKYAGLQLG